jgi:hypothetical protein
MVRNLNPARMNPLRGGKMDWWKFLGDEALAALIVSPERAAEIMRRYPEKEMMGRPGILATHECGPRLKKRSPEADEERNAPAEVEVSNAERTTTELFVDEDLLPLVEEEVMAAEAD